MIIYVRNYIFYHIDEYTMKTDAGIVLGAQVYSDGRLSGAAQQRADAVFMLWEKGLIDLIIVSWDRRTRRYDEVTAISNYILAKWVPKEILLYDGQWLDTYQSMLHAKNMFTIDRMIIPTQQFHVARSVYIARTMDIDAYGLVVDTMIPTYPWKLLFREFFARGKARIEIRLGFRFPLLTE